MDLLLHTPPLGVYEHMALDETLVRLRPQEITLRFYRWTPAPAVTFGCSQFIADVRRALTQQHFSGAYCRRPTGGGVVFHRNDLTFSLIFPSAQKPSAVYEELHTLIRVFLGEGAYLLGGKQPAAAYAPHTPTGANACFVNPVQNDLLDRGGTKILGGAIRRFGQTVLYQGSLQLPDARENTRYKHALLEAARHFTGKTLRPRRADQTTLAQAATLAQTRYATAAWTERF